MLETFCLIDRRLIPPERAAKKASTCSRECAQELRKARRLATDGRRCHHCGKPSTPEDRAAYQQWRRDTGRLKRRGRPKSESTKPSTALGIPSGHCDSGEITRPTTVDSAADGSR